MSLGIYDTLYERNELVRRFVEARKGQQGLILDDSEVRLIFHSVICGIASDDILTDIFILDK